MSGDPVRDYLSAIGRRGGQAGTAAQNAARARNGKLGGRPPKKRRKSSRHNIAVSGGGGADVH